MLRTRVLRRIFKINGPDPQMSGNEVSRHSSNDPTFKKRRAIIHDFLLVPCGSALYLTFQLSFMLTLFFNCRTHKNFEITRVLVRRTRVLRRINHFKIGRRQRPGSLPPVADACCRRRLVRAAATRGSSWAHWSDW